MFAPKTRGSRYSYSFNTRIRGIVRKLKINNAKRRNTYFPPHKQSARHRHLQSKRAAADQLSHANPERHHTVRRRCTVAISFSVSSRRRLGRRPADPRQRPFSSSAYCRRIPGRRCLSFARSVSPIRLLAVRRPFSNIPFSPRLMSPYT